MNRKALKYSLLAVICCSALGAFAGIEANDHQVESAAGRIRSALDQIGTPGTPQVGDERQSVYVPNLKGAGHQVPDFKDYGHAVNIDADPLSVAKRYEQKMVVPDAGQSTDLMVMVSFSMPEASLKRIAHETSKAGGVMVVRGFVDGSLRKTMAASEQISALGSDLLIHPELFDQYAVTEVPTIILARADDGTGSCAGKEEVCSASLQVKGDVSLHAALEYLGQQQGDAILIADANYRLAKLQGMK